MNERRLSWDAAKTNSAHETSTNAITKPGVSVPVGRARVWVRGLAASMEASARRLNAIAADRADTMAMMIQTSTCAFGIPFAASIAPHRANGSTKMECSHLIISRVTRRLRRTGTLEL